MNPLRIAAWSGPRNISTALMRAFENRTDCTVTDEPFYACYLASTGIDHPGREEVIRAGETDWRVVVEQLTGPVPGNHPVWYQKHMCHHMLPEMDTDWIHKLTNIFLIREPEAVVASYVRARKTGHITPEDIGLPQQAALFDTLMAAAGEAPIVIDSSAFLTSPEKHLRALCERLGIPFSARMLSWPPGPRATDGIWAPYWYRSVWKSTGFKPPRELEDIELEGRAAEVAQTCRPMYEHLREFRLERG